jgi:hypothetical protein
MTPEQEPIIHSHITDCLEESHYLANCDVFCCICKVMVHANNNECMQTWFETKRGNYCIECFKLRKVMA